MPEFALDRIERPTDEARALLAELDAELAANYAPEQRHALRLEQIFAPNVAFFIVRADAAAIGCGGVAFENGFAELKRMYVRPAMRGKGAVQYLLALLELTAAARGYARLTLETGDAQSAAIRAYERAGFVRRAAFGSYADLPPHAIVRSVFMEKPTMNFLQVTPFMHVRDMAKALAFFNGLLGFKTLFQAANYAYVQRETVCFRLLEDKDAPLGDRRFAYYIDVRDVDALYAELKAKLDTLPKEDVHGPFDKPYRQRELLVLAPDGNLLAFGHGLKDD